jgi:hypothetical protein
MQYASAYVQIMRISITMGKKPGSNTGKTGAIYQEIDLRGGPKNNFTTVPENTKLPPTSRPGNTWVPIKRTPHGHRSDELLPASLA